MGGYVNIFINDSPILNEKISVGISIYKDYSYAIDMYFKDNESFIDAINNKANLAVVKESIEILKLDFAFEDEHQVYEIVREQIENQSFYTDNSDFYFFGDVKSIGKFLRKNYELFKDKNIILGSYIDLDEKLLNELKEYFKYFPNVKLKVSGNEELVTINEYERTIYGINQIVNRVKSYGYSPFEELICVYDLIRDRFYVEEQVGDKATLSRDLTSSLLGDKIVCLGFANIFKAVCDKLGINSMIFCLAYNSMSGHVRNLVYLVDEKYDIDGLYFFDPTFDCKKDDNNSFLFSYRFFAKTYDEICRLSSKNYFPLNYKYFDVNNIEKLEQSIESENLDMFLLLKLLTDTKVNKILELIGREKIEPTDGAISRESFIEVLYDLYDMCSIQLDSKKFIKALYRVRRQQYYEEPTKYLFDIDALTCILCNSHFLSSDDSSLLRFLADIGISNGISIFNNRFQVEKFIDENDLDKDIERLRLLRVLKTISEQKENQEKKLEKRCH
ncbi:MAG: hypothetical protein ACI4XM_01040 [Candidatus Coprovivens sp.]